MSEKREALEGVYGAVPQDPRDMVKAGLPESQSPAMEPHTRRYHAWDAVPSRARRAAFATRTFRAMGDEERLHSRGCVGHLRRARHVQHHRNAGWPTGRESQGHGVLVVVRHVVGG